MKDEVVYIEDPLGHRVSLTKKLCYLGNHNGSADELYDDLYSVIKKPALLIETDLPAELNYFRSIGWQFSVLIKVKLERNVWEAYKCIVNPSDTDMIELMKMGRQII
jgi:hypothetical protein